MSQPQVHAPCTIGTRLLGTQGDHGLLEAITSPALAKFPGKATIVPGVQ
jgi:hypothetical protein